MISTHTPAWGVTVGIVSNVMNLYHFNSHARVGRDYSTTTVFFKLVNFNSHARVGRDVDLNEFYQKMLGISTHTPAWGVTIT